MQTFMPYEDFQKSASVLDKKRLFKQVVETRQILATNGVHVLKVNGEPYKHSHVHHPLHKIWKNYLDGLKFYHDVFLFECLFVRHINTVMKPFYKFNSVTQKDFIYPDLIGYEPFHRSMRSMLVKKKPDFYSQYGWEILDENYIWEVANDVVN